MIAFFPIRTRAPSTANAPTDAFSPITASEATCALASIPGFGFCAGKKISSVREKAKYGFGLMRTGHFARAANCSGTMTHAAVVVSSIGAYFSLATKIIVPGPAASIGAGMMMSTSPSPRNSRLSFAARSFNFIAVSSRYGHTQRRQGFKCFFRFDVAQTIVMAEAAGARKAWAAFEAMPNHAAANLRRTSAKRIGRSKNRDGRNSERAREMHASGIIADEARRNRK